VISVAVLLVKTKRGDAFNGAVDC